MPTSVLLVARARRVAPSIESQRFKLSAFAVAFIRVPYGPE